MSAFISQLISLLEDEGFVQSKVLAFLKKSEQQSEDYLPDEEYDIDTHVNLTANFSLHIDEIFMLLNASILHGEYFTESDIEDLQVKLLENSGKFISIIQATLINSPYYNTFSIVWKVIERAIGEFDEFITIVRNKARSEKKVYYPLNSDFNVLLEDFKYVQESDTNIYNKLYTDCINLYRLFRINATTSKNEFLLKSVDFDKLMPDLLSDINWIYNLKNTILLSDPIRLKCYYLFRKIRYRIQLESKEEIVFWDGTKEINLSEHEVVDPFSGWISTIKRHYELVDNSRTLTVDLVTKKPSTINQELEDLKGLQLHSHIKYYKDCTTGNYQAELNKLRLFFAKKYKSSSQDQDANIFDSYVYRFNLNYAINNEFSALLENPTSEFPVIKNLYDQISRVQEQSGIDNFFPQWKYLDYLINIKVKQKLSDGIFDKLSKVQFFLDEATRIKERYDHNIYWTQNTYNYVFYLPLNECHVDYKDKDDIINRIFIASSFVLPLVQNSYIDDYEQVKQELSNLRSSVEILTLIDSEQKSIKEKTNQLETDIKGKETKYIEILGIFASIITFAAAAFTTQLSLARGESADNLLPGLTSIGLILFLFVFAILIVTRLPFEKIWQKTHQMNLRKFYVAALIALITIVISVSVSYLLLNNNPVQPKPKKIKKTPTPTELKIQ